MIFEDPSRIRWRRILYISVITAIIGTILFVNALIIHSIVVQPSVPNADRYESEYKKKAEQGSLVAYKMQRGDETSTGANLDALLHLPENPAQDNIRQRIGKIRALSFFQTKPFIQGVFIVQNDPQSVQSLEAHIRQIDVAFPDWFTIAWSSCNISESINWSIFETLSRNKIPVFPRFSNARSNSIWGGSEFARFISDKKQSDCLIEALKGSVINRSAQGINIDIVDLSPQDRDIYTNWLLTLVESFHKSDLYVTVSADLANPAFDYNNIAAMSDAIILKAYDEHARFGKPGPIASDAWFERNLDRTFEVLSEKNRTKTIVAVGSYGYDWNTTTSSPAESRSFDNILLLAKNVNADIETDTKSKNSTFLYRSEDGSVHEVWFSDASSVWNQYLSIKKKQSRGMAFWRIGLEDPGVWKFVSAEAIKQFDPRTLTTLPNLFGTSFAGSGKVFKILQLPDDGRREISMSGKAIDTLRYDNLPQNLSVSLSGKPKERTITLTFNNGPDNTYTERILDVLKKYNVQATFFLKGDRMQKYPEIVKREYDEGHILGQHTLFQPNATDISEAWIWTELSNTEHLIESISGHQTLLVRSPYNIDTTVLPANEAKSLYVVWKMGYMLVGSDIDSRDFTNPGTDAIVKNVMSQISSTGSNIIVMHDAGGDRLQTVQALERLIPSLRAEGYRFIAMNEVLDVSKDAIMPPISWRSMVITQGKALVSWIRDWWWKVLALLFFLATILSVFRVVFLGIFVIRSRRIEKNYTEHTFEPPVTILIPAYNEETVIERTVTGLLQSDYPKFDILVIDDGSSDGTADKVQKLAQQYDNVRLISKKNEGKSRALNVGFMEVKNEYVITVDADTIVLPKTIHYLMEPFSLAGVDAVCGNIGVGNVSNILTAFQEVEYVTGQNYDRRAFDVLNCITVVPGATGAWRRQKVMDIGGYSSDTLVEDADLTLTLLENGGRIVYAPEARSVTEAPETVHALFKQRFRWSYGTFQCFWKHRGTFGKGPLGIIALPNMIFSQVIFNILSPIGDFVFIFSLFFWDVQMIMTAYLMFFVMDLAATGTAYTLDKKSIVHLWVIFIQRFFYRQFMYFVTFKSLIAALRWSHHGWNKLERKWTVTV